MSKSKIYFIYHIYCTLNFNFLIWQLLFYFLSMHFSFELVWKSCFTFIVHFYSLIFHFFNSVLKCRSKDTLSSFSFNIYLLVLGFTLLKSIYSQISLTSTSEFSSNALQNPLYMTSHTDYLCWIHNDTGSHLYQSKLTAVRFLGLKQLCLLGVICLPKAIQTEKYFSLFFCMTKSSFWVGCSCAYIYSVWRYHVQALGSKTPPIKPNQIHPKNRSY